MKHRRIPTWLLERYALGEAPPERAAEVREILASDPEEQARLAALERSNAEILAELPPAAVAAEVARRAAAGVDRAAPVVAGNGRRPGGPLLHRRMFALSSGLAVAAGLVLLVVAIRPGPADQPGIADPGSVGPDSTRPKGSPRLLLHRKRGDKVEKLDARSDLARAGDRIQISYQAGDAIHGIILSIDGAGAVTLHFPALAGGSTLLKKSGASLTHSYELDDAPGYERFVFLTSSQPIDVAAVLASAENLARDPQRAARDPLSLSSSVAQLWYTLRKEAAP